MASIIAKAEFENMLDLLNSNTLIDINRRIVAEEPYSWGRTPLLKYAPEALADYANVIYQQVIAPLNPDTATDDDLNKYIDQYLNFYRQAETAFTSASVDLAHRLLTISRTPIKPVLPPNHIDEGDNVYDLISDYFAGNSYDLYPHFHNFLYSYLSPLRRADLIAHDQRLIDLVKDVDELIAPYNTALDAFIWRELRRLQSAVKDRIRYTKLKPEDIDTLKRNHHRIPTDDWQSINQAINTRSLSASILKLIKRTLQDLKTAAPAPSAPAKPDIPLSAYTTHFMDSLEAAYIKLMAKRANAYAYGVDPIDDIIAGYHASQQAITQGINVDDIEVAQAKGREFFSNFANFRPVLSVCLQIDLYTLSVDSVFTPEVLNHGIIQGILAFTAKLRPHFKTRNLILMYDRLAEELYSSISRHTCGFVDALPLPDIAPLSDDVIAITPKAPRIAPDSKPLRFDLTQPIQDILSTLGADVVTTDTVVLSAPHDPNSLKPVDDQTIKTIACRLTGMDSAPYLLDGNLIIHRPQTNQYLKVLPGIREDGYADYVITAYNTKALKDRLNGLQNILLADPRYRYRSSVPHITATLPQGDPVVRQKAIKDLQEWADILLAQVNDIYRYDDNGDDTDDANDDYVVTKRSIRQIVQTPYYKLIYLSAHRLAAYVYYPKEYSTYIAAKPTDPVTGKPLVYHVHHKDGCRSNNCPENLEIVPKLSNDTSRSTSRPVIYQGVRYDTVKDYCEATDAGNYKNLQQALTGLDTSNDVLYNGRHYSVVADGIIKAVDNADTPTITYNNSVYANLKEFADVHKLSYKSLHNALSKARKDGKDRFLYKQYNFCLDNNGNIITVSK